MGLPTVTIEFKKLATTATTRSSGGTAAIVVLDSKETGTKTVKTYTAASQISSDDYSDTNYADIKRAFTAGPRKVVVVRLTSSATASSIASAIEKVNFDWICTNGAAAYQTALSSAVQAMNETARRAKKVKAVVTGVTSANDMHIVNVANTKVTISGDSSTTAMLNYLPRICGMLAACPITESLTYAILDDLESVEEVDDIDTSIAGGNFVLFDDDEEIRVARGVNTVTTTSATVTEDMKKIAVVEAMDLMQNDIVETFKDNYLGKVRNSADNQNLFLSDVIAYFNELEAQGVIEKAEDSSYASIDVDAMRTAWTDAGTDVSGLTDDEVKAKTYRSNVYITAACRIFDAMEDLDMVVALG